MLPLHQEHWWFPQRFFMTNLRTWNGVYRNDSTIFLSTWTWYDLLTSNSFSYFPLNHWMFRHVKIDLTSPVLFLAWIFLNSGLNNNFESNSFNSMVENHRLNVLFLLSNLSDNVTYSLHNCYECLEKMTSSEMLKLETAYLS